MAKNKSCNNDLYVEVDWGGCNGLHLFFVLLCTLYTEFDSLQTESVCPKIKDDIIAVYDYRYCTLWYNKRFHLTSN